MIWGRIPRREGYKVLRWYHTENQRVFRVTFPTFPYGWGKPEWKLKQEIQPTVKVTGSFYDWLLRICDQKFYNQLILWSLNSFHNLQSLLMSVTPRTILQTCFFHYLKIIWSNFYWTSLPSSLWWNPQIFYIYFHYMRKNIH